MWHGGFGAGVCHRLVSGSIPGGARFCLCPVPTPTAILFNIIQCISMRLIAPAPRGLQDLGFIKRNYFHSDHPILNEI